MDCAGTFPERFDFVSAGQATIYMEVDLEMARTVLDIVLCHRMACLILSNLINMK